MAGQVLRLSPGRRSSRRSSCRPSWWSARPRPEVIRPGPCRGHSGQERPVCGHGIGCERDAGPGRPRGRARRHGLPGGRRPRAQGHRHAHPAGHVRGPAPGRLRRPSRFVVAWTRPARRSRSATSMPWSTGWRSDWPTRIRCSPSTAGATTTGHNSMPPPAGPCRAAGPRCCGPGDLPCDRMDCVVRGAVVAPLGGPGPGGPGGAGGGGRRPAGPRAGAGDPGGGPVGRVPARPRRAGLVPGAAGPGRGTRAAGPDQPALHLQRADRDRLVRPHRPGARPRADPGVRRVHPVLVPGARRVHHAGRGTALDRPVPDHRAGPVRRPAAGAAADRARGAAGRPAVPLPAAAGRERGPARPVPQAGRRYGEHRGARRRGRMPHHGRGRRRRHGSRRCSRRGSRRGGERGRRPARRPVQRGRAAALGVRRPFRAGGGDRAGRGDEGEHAGAEVPSRGAGEGRT